MSIKLDNVVPFGRSLDEYIKMFNLTKSDLESNILGVAEGPASFNAELTAKGGRVTSIDPIYVFEASEIQNKFDAVLDEIIEQIKALPDDWIWSYHSSPEELRTSRIHTMKLFVRDFKAHSESGRYIVSELPMLPFENQQFDLALCSHFLFLYSDEFSEDFHIASIREMLRVACEVRIFPLLTLMREKSLHIEVVQHTFTTEGFCVEICPVEYELYKGGNEMMVIRK